MISIVLSIAGAYGGYSILEPYFSALRQQELQTKSDREPWETAVNSNVRDLSERLTRLEHTRTATIDDLETLKAVLEQQLQSLRPNKGKTKHGV